MSWVEERMGNEDTDKELSQMLLLGNVAQKTALGKGCRAESVWNMRRRQAGPEGVGGGVGRGELGLCLSEGRPLEAGGFRRGPAEAQALWAGRKHRGCGPAAALSPVV